MMMKAALSGLALASACAALGFLASGPALAQQTQAGISAEIDTNLASGQPGGISAAELRTTLHDMATAIFQAQGSGGLLLTGAAVAGYAPVASNATTAVWGSLGTLFGSSTGPLFATNTTVPADRSTPGFAFTDNGVTGLNFPDNTTHFSFTIAGNTPTGCTTTCTGSYEGFIVNETGAGRSPNAYVTGAQFNAIANSGQGNYTGSNSFALINSGATVQTAVGAEINVIVSSGATTNYKEGIRIADLGAVDVSGSNPLSAGIVEVRGSGAAGFIYGLYFGDPVLGDGAFPISSTGSLLKASTSAATIASGIDISGIAGFTNCAICLPANVGIGVSFGALGFGHGGRITSQTIVNAPDLIFGNNLFAVQFGGSVNAIIAQSTGNVVISGGVTASLPTSAGSGGLAVCVDTAGVMYKKATCP